MDAPLLTPSAAAARLGISTRELSHLIAGRRIPYVELPGGQVRFRERELDAWLTNLRRDAIGAEPGTRPITDLQTRNG